MAAKKLRVGIVGTGMIAQSGHIPAWKNLSKDVEMVGVADIVEDRAKLIAKTQGMPHAYGDWQKMLDEVDLDIVSVCTPNSYHKDITIAALGAGAHVLCEKPIATSHGDAVEMYDAANAAGRVLMVGQSSRFTPSALAGKEIVGSGRLGEIYFAETYMMRRRGIPKWGQFHMKEHSGGGPVYDLGVHILDLILWTMGSPKVLAVSGMTYTKFGNREEDVATSLGASGAPQGVLMPRAYDCREYDVEDMAVGFIRLENNATVLFKTSWAANLPKSASGSLILGTEAGLSLNPLVLVTNMDRYPVTVEPEVPGGRNVPFAGHWAETEHLVKVIRGEAELMVKREEVLNVMLALDGLYESADQAREVKVASD